MSRFTFKVVAQNKGKKPSSHAHIQEVKANDMAEAYRLCRELCRQRFGDTYKIIDCKELAEVREGL